jgi:hypothetical protein
VEPEKVVLDRVSCELQKLDLALDRDAAARVIELIPRQPCRSQQAVETAIVTQASRSKPCDVPFGARGQYRRSGTIGEHARERLGSHGQAR